MGRKIIKSKNYWSMSTCAASLRRLTWADIFLLSPFLTEHVLSIFPSLTDIARKNIKPYVKFNHTNKLNVTPRQMSVTCAQNLNPFPNDKF